MREYKTWAAYREWRMRRDGSAYLVLEPHEFGGVYQIINRQTGAVYVGMSSEIMRRFVSHMQDLEKGSHQNASLQAEYNEHGADAYTVEIIALAPTDKERYALEGEVITRLILGGGKVHNDCPIAKDARRALQERGFVECSPPDAARRASVGIHAEKHSISHSVWGKLPPLHLAFFWSVYGHLTFFSRAIQRRYADMGTGTVKARRKKMRG